jgi:FtsP/CotA-like multicopper oxidase with cupredoxin domain
MATPPSDGKMSRRSLLATSAGLAGAALVLRGQGSGALAASIPATRASAAHDTGDMRPARALAPGLPNRDYAPVVVPNGAKLPWRIVDGVKVFHLIAEEVEHEFAPGLSARCWGYNGRVHGPLIEAVDGDHVRIYVTNRLQAPTSVHWHGVLLPNGMDGVGGLNQAAIAPGDTFMYEWVFRQHGTLMYHAHHDEMTQMAMGMTGMIVVHPRAQRGPRVDRDFAILLHEWRIDPGARRPDPNEMMDFNVLTMNARVFPGTDALVVKRGQRVRIRLGNLSAMDHHPIHIHGLYFKVTETDGGAIPVAAQWPEVTVLVAAGQTRTIELVPEISGDWAMHCHMTHHVMNQMGHGLRNMVGVDAAKVDPKVRKVLPGYMSMGSTGMGDMATMGMEVPKNSIPMVGAAGKHDYITMGGMFTILKVRDRLTSYKDPGWYDNPPGTLATTATSGDLRRDGIDVKANSQVDEG